MTLKRTFGISPVAVPRAGGLLAAQLRNMISDGSLVRGDALSTEKELMDSSGLSRAAVRDALRILETEGLIVTRSGRNGGSVVTLPDRSMIARQVETYVRLHRVEHFALLECRVAVEPSLARLAAQHRTAAELERLQDLHREFEAVVDDVAAYKHVNLQWHLEVARCARNEPLIALVEALVLPIREAMDRRHVTTPQMRRLAVQAHARIMAAIADGDGDAAGRRMLRHVGQYREVAIAAGEDHPLQPTEQDA